MTNYISLELAKWLKERGCEEVIEGLAHTKTHITSQNAGAQAFATSYKSLKEPILIGDVLQRMRDDVELELITQDGWGVDVGSYDAAKLLNFWGQCGFTKSLQQILEEAKIREIMIDDPDLTNPWRHVIYGPAADLFTLLHNIFITTK